MFTDNQKKEFVNSLVHKIDQDEDITTLIGFSDDEYARAENYAYKLYTSGKHKEAAVLLKGLVQMNKPRAYPCSLLGDIYFQSKQYKQACELFGKAHSYDSSDPWISLKLAESYIHMDQPKRAQPLLEDVLRCEDDKAVLLKKKAASLLKTFKASKKS